MKFDNIKKLAKINRMHLNLPKTKEMIFRRPNIHLDLITLILDSIERVEEANLLGIIFVIT